MFKLLTLNGVLSIALLSMGCNSSNSPDVSTQSGLLRLTDLPAGTVARKSLDPDNPCSPLPLLRSENGTVKRTPSFKSGHFYVQESIAAYSSVATSATIYASLTSRERAECIANSAQFAGRVLEASLDRNQFGVHEHTVTLKLKREQRRIEVQVASLKRGQAVAVLLLVADPAPLSRKGVRRVLAVAAERLAQAKSP